MSSAPSRPGPVWTVVVAAGGGTRYGSAKQFEDLAGRSVLDWSVDAARAASTGVVVVVPSSATGEGGADHGVVGVSAVVAGGATRSDSVRAGLAAVPDDAAVIVVHDAARPAASPELFARVVAAVAAGHDAVVPGVPVADSLRWVTGGALDRDEVVAVQTPQAFAAAVLRHAHALGGVASDDATLVEATGVAVATVPGEETNRKLTVPADRCVLETVLAARNGPVVA